MAGVSPPAQGMQVIAAPLIELQQRMRAQEAPTGTELAASLSALETTVAALSGMQHRSYAEWAGSLSGLSGWRNPPLAALEIVSNTGRIEIGYGGSLNGGDGFFAFSVTRVDTGEVLVTRDSVLQNLARRVAVTGGASFAPSGHRAQPVDVPTGVQLRVTLEVNAASTFTTFLGASVSARVVA